LCGGQLCGLEPDIIGKTSNFKTRTQNRDGSFAVPVLLLQNQVSGAFAPDRRLDDLDVFCLPTFGAFGHVELDALAFLQ
jgi:hypothetical protein